MNSTTEQTARRFIVVHSMEDLPEGIPARQGREGSGYTLPNWKQVGQYRATAWAYLNREDGGAVVILNGQRYTHGNPPLLTMPGGKKFDRKSASPSGQVAAFVERVGAMLRLGQKHAEKLPKLSASNVVDALAELATIGIRASWRESKPTFTANGERFDDLTTAVLEACGLESDALEATETPVSSREQRRLDRLSDLSSALVRAASHRA